MLRGGWGAAGGAGAAEPVAFADAAVARRFRLHRRAVDAGELRLVDLCRGERLELATDRIHYFSHWITPEGPPRRYDTRFFVAAAPAGQVPLHDDCETVASLWLTPGEALRRHEAGTLDLILPTVKNLEAIASFDDSASLLGRRRGAGGGARHPPRSASRRPRSRSTWPTGLERERAVVAALAGAGAATAEALVPQVYADVGALLHPIARFSLWAHLRKLAGEGRAAAGDPDDPDTTWRLC